MMISNPSSSSSWTWLLSVFLFILVLISSIFSTSTVEALVPKSKTFKYVNDGPDTFSALEYGGPCRPLNIYNLPFQLFFYTTVMNGKIGFILGLAMVTSRGKDQNDPYRWVWAANAGNPVFENAFLTFGGNGNLVLAHANGRVAWQTGTANKGVVDLKLLPNGNLVLVDKRGRFVWQSFDHPTDTLLVGQSLVSGGKLLSRASTISDDTRGHYSMVLEKNRLAFYDNTPPPNKPLLYYEISLMGANNADLVKNKVMNVTFEHVSAAGTKEPLPHSDLLRLEFFNNVGVWGSAYLAQQKYNSSLSFLRLGWDGNLQVYTLYDINSYNGDFSAWEVTYTALTMDSYPSNLCNLPEKCGLFGICENNQCVACPTPKGLKPWSENTCMPPSKLPSCNINSNGTNTAATKNATSTMISYYKIEDVDHILSRYEEGQGPMKIGECKKKCSKDCNCVAFFYRTDTSKCLLTTQLTTLIKADFAIPSTHLAYIKYQK
ncbi:Bulb-type lectin domain [Macleaya cordata]|uniref:Bulb-type lectin domain n=1 Tax=Macleaya cordata TaxID=56857 RepID=A0A200R1B1_MACCD|nr:Bulb-type lectin domain [Macleaya cordata]